MISVSEARQKIEAHSNIHKIAELPISKANGHVLAESPVSKIDTPPFNQSAMDGYAFLFDSWDGQSALKLVGEVQAGSVFQGTLKAGDAVRIFTGAPVPLSADTVVMQEKVIVNGDNISFTESPIKGANVRLRASQTQKGANVLPKGQLLIPAGISFLAGLGIDKVKVFNKPMVAIIVTGSELVKPGNEVLEGEIFESNSFGLVAGLEQMNIIPVSVVTVNDNEEAIRNEISKQFGVDILILSGGVSVGDYDFVTSSLAFCGVETIFHKVKQKPGKPIYFGKKGETLCFGLPGNPASVMTCFYEFLVPTIESITKRKYFKSLALPLSSAYKKKPGLTQFLKGKTGINDVSILKSQESYLMNSFAIADCLIELDAEKENFEKGEMVMVQMII